MLGGSGCNLARVATLCCVPHLYVFCFWRNKGLLCLRVKGKTRCGKQGFTADTGSVLWVFPCPPACREDDNWDHEAENPVFWPWEWLFDQAGCVWAFPHCWPLPSCDRSAVVSSDAALALPEVTRDVTVLFTYCEHVACRGGARKSQKTLVRDRKGREQVAG